MNRKRTQTQKAQEDDEGEETPAKRSRRARKTQNKVFHNFLSQTFWMFVKILTEICIKSTGSFHFNWTLC